MMVLASVHVTGLSMYPAMDLSAGDAVTFTAQAISESGDPVYYRFDLVSDYGTAQYDPYNNSRMLQDFSTSNTCSHTFSSAGHYIIVVFASAGAQVTGDNSMIGKRVSVGVKNPFNISSLTMNVNGRIEVGDAVTFTIETETSGQDAYYRFDLVPFYGTAQYDPYNNYKTIQDFSKSSATTYTFESSGAYILVAYASNGDGFLIDPMPIIGGSIKVSGGSDQNSTGNQEFDLNNAEMSDPLYGYRAETPQSNLIPVRVDYSSLLPEVKNQGSTSSCTAWSTAYYYKTYQEVVEQGWDKNQHAFSPMYLYAMQCRTFSQPWNFIRAWEILSRYGCAKYSTFPFLDLDNDNEKSRYAGVEVPQSAHAEAINFRCGEKNQLKNLSQVKQALTFGPVLLGINYYNALLSAPSPENNYLTYAPSNSNAGHAILCVGYDDEKFGVGALKFVNSWGKQWAIDGYSWIRYTDVSRIINFAMTIKDIPNVNQSDNTGYRPSPPVDVAATDNVGPYVDVTWSKVTSAQYYRIFRAKVDDRTTYREIGTTYQAGYRDYPAPGITYYYSVVAFNDVGNSDHFASDTSAKSHVDEGSAKGTTISKPTLAWVSNNDTAIRSDFVVSDIHSTATSMEILVASGSSGPYYSFGWIAPGNFSITWGEDSEYIGKKPFVKIVAASPDGYSELSDPVQVGQTISGNANIANVYGLKAAADSRNIVLTWDISEGQADFFQVWRWLAAEDEGNEWIFIGNADSTSKTYSDTTALPGKNYYYAVGGFYQGASGEFAITDTPATITTSSANLFLYEMYYNYGRVSNPVNFKLTVWNDGGVSISDYAISITVYDWDDGNIYSPFKMFKASDVAAPGQLPLQAGNEHVLSFSMNIPSVYADGHHYSWIVHVDADQSIDELYEDDNIIVARKSWWSYDLSTLLSNLYLSGIRYNYGRVSNPVYFETVVENNGQTAIEDYSIAIRVHDWNNGKIYNIFNPFRASSVALNGQLPLLPGYRHTLAFYKDIPSVYADGHYYSWLITIDDENAINETSEDDNFARSNQTWWAFYGALRSAEPPPLEKRENPDQSLDVMRRSSERTVYTQTTGKSIAADTWQPVPGMPGTGYASSRPFSKHRLQNALPENGIDSSLSAGIFRRADQNRYVGNIRFKKPSFCVNHEK